MLRMILLFVQVFSASAIVGLVLLQRGKGAEAGAGFGAGASGTVFGARGATTALSRATAVFAAIFMINSLALAYMGTRGAEAPQKTILDEALATCERTGHRAFEAELHRARGEMLLKRDRPDPAVAKEALQTAIAVARRQTARSFELRAALSLAKLCLSTGQVAEAHAVLAPALEGFAPTPEMPEIAEAQALLSQLV